MDPKPFSLYYFIEIITESEGFYLMTENQQQVEDWIQVSFLFQNKLIIFL